MAEIVKKKTVRLVGGERLYLIAILKGMYITIRHLIRNVFKQDFETIEYPEVRKEMAEREQERDGN